MVVKINELGTAEREAEEQEVSKKAKGAMDEILKTMDLPEEDAEEKKKPLDPDEEEDTEDEDEDEDGGEEDTEDEEESDEDEDESEDESEAPEEDLIPRSKLKKIEEKTARRIAQQNRKIRELQEQIKAKEQTQSDPDRAKLEKMSKDELKSLRRECRKEQRYAEDERLDRLIELEEKIDETLATSSTRITAQQDARYNAQAEEILEAEGDMPKEVANYILKKAAEIFQGSATMRGSVEGKAEALRLAYEHYKEVRAAAKGKTGDKKLKRTVNNLKRKTTLDTSSNKRSQVSTQLKKLRDKAFRGGTEYDKERLVGLDPRFGIDDLIPDQFKQ